MRRRFRIAHSLCGLATAAVLGSVALEAKAQAPLTVYADGLLNGFQDWGWAAHNYANTSPPIHSGSASISVTIGAAYEGLQMVHSAFDSTAYSSVSFWLHGGASGGQRLQISGLAQVGSTQNVWQTSFSLGTLTTNWQQFTVPLSALGLANKGNATGIVFQDRIGAAQPTFYVDDVVFNAVVVPAQVNVSVNATQAVHAVDARHFGVNIAIWDGNYETAYFPTTISLCRKWVASRFACLAVRLQTIIIGASTRHRGRLLLRSSCVSPPTRLRRCSSP
jgi:hypothetical protein